MAGFVGSSSMAGIVAIDRLGRMFSLTPRRGVSRCDPSALPSFQDCHAASLAVGKPLSSKWERRVQWNSALTLLLMLFLDVQVVIKNAHKSWRIT